MSKIQQQQEKEIENLKDLIKYQANEIKLIDGFSKILQMHIEENAQVILTPIKIGDETLLEITLKSDSLNNITASASSIDIVQAFKRLQLEIWHQRNQLDAIVDFIGG